MIGHHLQDSRQRIHVAMIQILSRPTAARTVRRWLSTLPTNPSIYVHPDPQSSPQSYTLSLLPTRPALSVLALGTAFALPPTPSTFSANTHFLPLLSSVLRKYATQDIALKAQASALTTPSTFSPVSNHPSTRRTRPSRGTAAAPGAPSLSGRSRSRASGGGGGGHASGGGVGGYIHLSDSRNPPDYGRIAWPEDIFGSLEVDENGDFVGEDGGWQDSGSYRIITNDGILGLTPFLMGKLRLRLEEEERKINGKR